MALDVGPHCLDIGDVRHLLRGGDTAKGRVRMRSNKPLARARRDKRGRSVVGGGGAKGIRVAEVQRSELGGAEPHRVLQHCAENGLQVAGRTGNDPQHLGGRRLLLKRLVTFASGLVELLTQVSI